MANARHSMADFCHSMARSCHTMAKACHARRSGSLARLAGPKGSPKDFSVPTEYNSVPRTRNAIPCYTGSGLDCSTDLQSVFVGWIFNPASNTLGQRTNRRERTTAAANSIRRALKTQHSTLIIRHSKANVRRTTPQGRRPSPAIFYLPPSSFRAAGPPPKAVRNSAKLFGIPVSGSSFPSNSNETQLL